MRNKIGAAFRLANSLYYPCSVNFGEEQLFSVQLDNSIQFKGPKITPPKSQ